MKNKLSINDCEFVRIKKLLETHCEVLDEKYNLEVGEVTALFGLLDKLEIEYWRKNG